MVFKLHEPIGNPLFAPLLIRVPLGTYFLMAAMVKLNNPEAFIQVVRKLGVLPEPLSTLFGILLPYAEFGVGALLVLGFWTSLASILASLMLLSFVFAFGIRDHLPFNKDLLLLGAALSLLYSGAGAWSIDRFRKLG